LSVSQSRRVALPISILLAVLAVIGFAVHSLVQTTSSEHRGSPLRLVLYADSGVVLAECRAYRQGQALHLQPTRNLPAERTVCAGRPTPSTREVTEYSNTGKVIAKCSVQFVGLAVLVTHRSAGARVCGERPIAPTTPSRG
jgi:hypothetical protein